MKKALKNLGKKIIRTVTDSVEIIDTISEDMDMYDNIFVIALAMSVVLVIVKAIKERGKTN